MGVQVRLGEKKLLKEVWEFGKQRMSALEEEIVRNQVVKEGENGTDGDRPAKKMRVR